MHNRGTGKGNDNMTIIWLMFCVLIGYCAEKKGRNGWAWGISAVFLTPVLTGITLALMPDEKDEKAQETFPVIGSEDYKYEDDEYEDEDGEDDDEEKYCPECGYQAQPGEKHCPRCGEMLW